MVDVDIASDRQVLIMGDFNNIIFDTKLNERFSQHSLFNVNKILSALIQLPDLSFAENIWLTEYGALNWYGQT